MNQNTTTTNRPFSAVPRRQFLKGAMALGAGSLFAPNLLLGKSAMPASERINLACVGIGNRGGAIIEELMATGMFNIVALCDTQMGDPHTHGILEQYPDAPRFHDFRKMFDKLEGQIDAVSVGTPDHTHFPVCMHAMALGKGVYVEKPLAHTYQECDLLMKAEAKYKVACQMGNQGHSGPNVYQFQAMVKAGVMDNVTRMDAHMTKGRRWHKWQAQVPTKGMTWEEWFNKADEMPAGMDWDTWLGQNPYQPFHKDYINGDWRCWYMFGNGALGDWGAHIIDAAHEFLNLGLPVAVDLDMIEGHNDHVFPMSSTLNFRFPERGKNMPAMDIVWSEGVGNLPELPEGFHETKTDDEVAPPSGGSGNQVKATPPGKIIYRADGASFKGSSHGGTLAVIENEHAAKVGDLPEFESDQPNHFMDFALGVKGEKTCNSNFAVAGELSKVLSLGCIAQRLKTSIKFDPKTETIPGNEIANQMLVGPAPRKGWEQYYQV